MPDERTRSVLQARDFLRQLSVRAGIPPDIRREARRLLRHYPDSGYIDSAAIAWPEQWSPANEPPAHVPSYMELVAQVLRRPD